MTRDLICRITGDGGWPESVSTKQLEQVLVDSVNEGMKPLVLRCTSEKNKNQILTPSLQPEIHRETVHLAAQELMLQEEIKNLLNSLGDNGVETILIKGAHLAYDIYPSPELRSREDTDILIFQSAIEKTKQTLLELGYDMKPEIGGKLVHRQFGAVRILNQKVIHVVDIHWQISNVHIFAELFTFDELVKNSKFVPLLGTHARGLKYEYALLLACVHRIAHHPNEIRLIWLYDIHLLVGILDTQGFASFLQLAVDRKVAEICHHEINLAQQHFGTEISETMLARLGAVSNEDSARYLSETRGKLKDFSTELGSIHGWKMKLQFIIENAFPSSTYMKKQYQTNNSTILPWLYIRRIFLALVKHLRQ